MHLRMLAYACVCLRLPASALAAYALATCALGTYAYASGAHLFRHHSATVGLGFSGLSQVHSCLCVCACVRSRGLRHFFFNFFHFSLALHPQDAHTDFVFVLFCKHVIKASGACAGPRILFSFVVFVCVFFFAGVRGDDEGSQQRAACVRIARKLSGYRSCIYA